MPCSINLSKPLIPLVDKYQTERKFSSRALAANELIRIGLETEEKRK